MQKFNTIDVTPKSPRPKSRAEVPIGLEDQSTARFTTIDQHSTSSLSLMTKNVGIWIKKGESLNNKLMEEYSGYYQEFQSFDK